MAPWIEPDSVICSDGNLAYQRVAQQTGCEHITAKVQRKNTAAGNAKGLSIGRIDAYHRDVENLINRRCSPQRLERKQEVRRMVGISAVAIVGMLGA